MKIKRSITSQLLASVMVNSFYVMVNYPIVLTSTILAPFSLLLIITFVSHGTLTPIAIGGALMMTMLASGTTMQQDLSHLKNDFKVQDMVVSSPTKPWIYLLGMALSEIVYSIPAIVVLGVLAALYIHSNIIGYLSIILVLLIIFAFASAIGFIFSTFSTDIVQSWAFTGIISTILSAFAPVYYPITYIPMPFRYIAYLSPTTYAAEILQNTTGIISFSSGTILVDWIVIIVVALAMVIIAVRKSKWRDE